jgi:hypothetical protein
MSEIPNWMDFVKSNRKDGEAYKDALKRLGEDYKKLKESKKIAVKETKKKEKEQTKAKAKEDKSLQKEAVKSQETNNKVMKKNNDTKEKIKKDFEDLKNRLVKQRNGEKVEEPPKQDHPIVSKEQVVMNVEENEIQEETPEPLPEPVVKKETKAEAQEKKMVNGDLLKNYNSIVDSVSSTIESEAARAVFVETAMGIDFSQGSIGDNIKKLFELSKMKTKEHMDTLVKKKKDVETKDAKKETMLKEQEERKKELALMARMERLMKMK